jgi:hypothetical protein
METPVAYLNIRGMFVSRDWIGLEGIVLPMQCSAVFVEKQGLY